MRVLLLIALGVGAAVLGTVVVCKIVLAPKAVAS